MKIHLSKPCHEDWNAMTYSEVSEEHGRFCGVCAKVVVDFTKMNDDEIVEYFQQHQRQNTCGHYRNDQLVEKQRINIDLAKLPKNIPFRSLLVACFISFFSSIFFISCMGKQVPTREEVEMRGEISIIDSSQIKPSDSIVPVTNLQTGGDPVLVNVENVNPDSLHFENKKSNK